MDFHGLVYFPENPTLRFELLLERYADLAGVQMQTGTGSVVVSNSACGESLEGADRNRREKFHS